MDKNIENYEKDIKRDFKNGLEDGNVDTEKSLFSLKELNKIRLEIENNIWDLKEKVKIEEKREEIYKLREVLKEGDSCLLCGEIYKQRGGLDELNKNDIRELRKRLNHERRRYEDIQDIIISEF